MTVVFVILVARGGLLTISCVMHVVACMCCGLHGAGPISARLQDLVASQQLQRDEGQVGSSRHQTRAHSQHSHHHQRQLHYKAGMAQRLSPPPISFAVGQAALLCMQACKEAGMRGRAAPASEASCAHASHAAQHAARQFHAHLPGPDKRHRLPAVSMT